MTPSTPENQEQSVPTLILTTRPNDANQNGDVFGGWLMSQIDIAGAIRATAVTKGPVATVAVKSMQFIQPVFVFDLVTFYTDIVQIGTTSITINISVYAKRHYGREGNQVKVADAVYVYVAIDKPGVKRVIKKD